MKVLSKEKIAQGKNIINKAVSNQNIKNPLKPLNTIPKTLKSPANPLQNKKIASSNIQIPKVEEVKKTGLFTEKPSKKYTSIKTIDPFADLSKSKINSFAYVYNSGGIPCKIDHHGVSNRLKWDNNVSVGDLNYDPILVTCFEGLVEEKHPYNFIVPCNTNQKVINILNKLVWPLRTGLLSDNLEVFENSLNALKYLSDVVKENLNPYLKNILSPIIKKIDKKNLKEKCFDVLRKLQENGGPDVAKIIKTTIPTFSSG